MSKNSISIEIGVVTLIYIILCCVPTFEVLQYKIDVSFDIITFIAVIAIDNFLDVLIKRIKEE